MVVEQDDPVDVLRRRNVPLKTESGKEARETVLQLNALEDNTHDVENRKTFGRTPDGTVFTVPTTHDMVSQLLSPTEPKNVSDMMVIVVLALHIYAYYALPHCVRVPVLGAIFLLWRAGYNVGIGWLLHNQSHQLTMVRWAKKSKLFGKPQECDRPKLRAFIKRELETKIPKDYDFDTAPLEYNTWLVFRRIVDLILMCDFTSYVLFAIACSRNPLGETLMMTGLRWSVGITLFIFNLWVKLDAHRVVKDYAWYWGDFFYLIDQDLTFDGVFEMAPHPMYSIGYVGYYGISLMAASYKVLFVSIIAHAAQFAFLIWVENPHIERTYNAPPPRKQINNPPKAADDRPNIARQNTADAWPNPSSDKPSATHNLLGLQNLDLYRTTDSAILVLSFFFLLLTLSSPNTPAYQAFFVINAAVWRLWFSIGIGYLLNRQSVKKKWTRHFLKYGDSTGESWRQWKGAYHMSMILCYTSFAAAAWKIYQLPHDWEYGLVLLKHVVGLSLVILQVWVSTSIYDSLGEFGWFYGDFFFDKSPQLTYGGIYRFLNNPERVLGLAGIWGVALITNSKAIFGLALLSHTLSIAFIQFVERPHMQKIYGRNLRQDSGLVRSIKRSLPPPFRQWQDEMDKVLDNTFDVVEEFLEGAKPKLASGVNTFVQDTKLLLRNYPARITVTRIEPEIVGLDPADYKIEVEGESMTFLADGSNLTRQRRMSSPDDCPQRDISKTMMFAYGSPIKVKWTAPLKHAKLDWIGLYMTSDNKSREITRISSGGRWIATNPGEYDTASAEIGMLTSDVKITIDTEDGEQKEYMTGEMIFAGTKLWWTQGSYEFRYHHNGKHNVMAISAPFEVRIPRFSEDDLDLTELSAGHMGSQNESSIRRSIEQTLLPIVQNCFDRDVNIAPSTGQETFGGLVERDGKFARRVVYAIHQMFGVEFAPEVVKADGKVENLAWRIWEAKKVLAPYSMSRSKGTSTPVEEKHQDF